MGHRGEQTEQESYRKISSSEPIFRSQRGLLLQGSSSGSYMVHAALLFLVLRPTRDRIYAVFLTFSGIAVIVTFTVIKIFGRASAGLIMATFDGEPTQAYFEIRQTLVLMQNVNSTCAKRREVDAAGKGIM